MSQRYEITIRGHLASPWAAAFEGMQITCLEDGNTHIAGDLPDQSALLGVLMRLHNLNLTILMVRKIEEE